MQSDLVERVTCAIYGEDSLDGLGSGVTSIMRSKGALAVAAVLDAMWEPSEGMLAAVVTEPTHLYGLGGRDAEYERDMKNAVAVERLVKRQDWQDMLDAVQREAGL